MRLEEIQRLVQDTMAAIGLRAGSPPEEFRPELWAVTAAMALGRVEEFLDGKGPGYDRLRAPEDLRRMVAFTCDVVRAPKRADPNGRAPDLPQWAARAASVLGVLQAALHEAVSRGPSPPTAV